MSDFVKAYASRKGTADFQDEEKWVFLTSIPFFTSFISRIHNTKNRSVMVSQDKSVGWMAKQLPFPVDIVTYVLLSKNISFKSWIPLRGQFNLKYCQVWNLLVRLTIM